MLKRLLIFIVGTPTLVFGQVNTATWGIEDTIITIEKTQDFGVVHDYLELYNNAGSDLDMRWICHEPGSWPLLWETDFTDPDSNFYDVQDLDSHDFVLPYPVGFSNKLIIGVDHAQIVHTDTIKFKVFPLNYPEDSLNIYYVIIIHPSGTGIGEVGQYLEYIFSPATSNLFLKWDREADLSIFDLSGKLVLHRADLQLNSGKYVNLSELQRGTFLVNLSVENGEKKSFKLIIP